MDKILSNNVNIKILSNFLHLNKPLIRNFRKLFKKKQPFLILRATREDYKCILKLMCKSYYPEEPTCRSLGVKANTIFDDLTLQSLSEGLSYIAKCKYTGEIVGSCINETTSPWDPDIKEKIACNIKCEKFKHLLLFYAYMQRIPNIWERCNVQKVFEMTYLFVRKEDRGRGLGLELMKHSRELAANCGYPVVRVDATSQYTAALCDKLKMKMVHEIPYCAYVGADQKPIFKPPPPHESVKIYVDTTPHEKR